MYPSRDLIKKMKILWFHMIRIHYILPPVVDDSIFAAGGLRQMPEPPDVMFADIAIPPVMGCDFSNISFEVWKVIQPVVTLTGDGTWIIPIIVPLTVRREMDISQRSLARRGLLVTDEPPP